MIVSKSRSLIKSLTWRVVAIVTTFISAYLITNEEIEALKVTVLTNTINFILYYGHERGWNYIQWGRK